MNSGYLNNSKTYNFSGITYDETEKLINNFIVDLKGQSLGFYEKRGL